MNQQIQMLTHCPGWCMGPHGTAGVTAAADALQRVMQDDAA